MNLQAETSGLHRKPNPLRINIKLRKPLNEWLECEWKEYMKEYETNQTNVVKLPWETFSSLK